MNSCDLTALLSVANGEALTIPTEITFGDGPVTWPIVRRSGILGIGRDCTARAEARQKRIDAITKAEGVMPSDGPRVLTEFYASRPITWAVADPQPVSAAKSLPGALDVASGGHRFGGWGATE